MRFDRAPGMFTQCSRYISTVLDHALTVLEVGFDRAQGLFRLCSNFAATVLEVCFECD